MNYAKGTTPGPWRWNGIFLVPVNPDPKKQAVHTIIELGQWSGTGYTSSARQAVMAEDAANLRFIEQMPEVFSVLVELVLKLSERGQVHADIKPEFMAACDVLAKASPRWPA